MSDPIRDQIRQVIVDHARLAVSIDEVTDGADLFLVGMSSITSVHVMLGLEEVFGVEFLDTMLRRDVFSSIDAMAEVVETLTATMA
jgi:acyl carrier protein